MDQKLRSANDLSDLDMGVFIVREEIKKHIKAIETGDYNQTTFDANQIKYIEHFLGGQTFPLGLAVAINICNDLLDIANIGDIASTKEELEQ
jgi:hypothetical protein